ncbi:MAG TPA: DmsC/YnfH family molybdoenzyme membrane anchor subunit [Kiloniellales bacterium]|jgi:DMSO reductase anchor subunit|nr:DmsC/YnfH family molybdoenzyme membrane anchor subunit [Kiloniellales bacterium]
MHPAYSVILFTTTSGAGYGLLALLGLTAATEAALPRIGGLIALLLALGLITFGLLASTFHLGRPERAWRAFSQWRSSWLSREGVLAVATYVPALALGLLWLSGREGDWLLALVGVTAAVLSILTVMATGMIYASLKTIRQWHHPLVVPAYLSFALAGGGTLLLIFASFGGVAGLVHWILASAGLVLTLLLVLLYWRSIDRQPRDLDPAAATGLSNLGPVRQWEAAHTADNYVQREMGYQVARRHTGRLRRLTLLGMTISLLLVIASALLPGLVAGLAALLAALLLFAASLVQRWLFFAQAEHIVSLYYGAQRA